MDRISVVLFILPFLAAEAAVTKPASDGCVWPCPVSTEVCAISPGGVSSCQPLQHAQWIIPSPGETPIYSSVEALRQHINSHCELPPGIVISSFTKAQGNCAKGLYCSPITSTCQPVSPPYEHTHVHRKRENGSNFSSSTDHSLAFNVIHVIAAVIGVIVALLVCVAVFLLYRRRLHKDEQCIKRFESSSEFDRFAHAYCNDDENLIQPPPSAHCPNNQPDYRNKSDPTLVSPSMQQVQLQWRMMEFQRHHQAAATTEHTPPSLPAPPPYQP